MFKVWVAYNRDLLCLNEILHMKVLYEIKILCKSFLSFGSIKKKRKLTIQILLFWIFFYHITIGKAKVHAISWWIISSLQKMLVKSLHAHRMIHVQILFKKIDRKLFFYVPYKDCFLGLLCKSLLRLKFCWVIFFFNSVDSSKEWIIFVQVIPGMYYSVALQQTMLLFTESDISISVL